MKFNHETNRYEDDKICPHCNEREVEIDDLGYFGCEKCMPKLSQAGLERILDQDGTGQAWETEGSV